MNPQQIHTHQHAGEPGFSSKAIEVRMQRKSLDVTLQTTHARRFAATHRNAVKCMKAHCFEHAQQHLA
jgi:hypothetical protein